MTYDAKAMQATHTPVLLHQSIDSLEIKKGDIFLDGTVGSGGHSALVAERFGSSVTVIGLDRDTDALRRSETLLRSIELRKGKELRLHLFEESFRNLDKVLEGLGVSSVNAILFDIGISSDQLETSGRGFSFQRDEPLLMTMKEKPEEDDLTAAYILNNFEEESLELILRGFGEEKYSRKIAREIVKTKESKPFVTTFDLVAVINRSVPERYKRGRINAATKTFQALRIAVNEELVALEEGLTKGFDRLAKEGRIALITFHSLEDRIVKNFYRERAKEGTGTLINKKPIIPSEEEVALNPRARSAKLRVIGKL